MRLPIPGPIRASVYSVVVLASLILHFSILKYQLLPTVLVFCLGMQVAAVVSIPLIVLFVRWRNRRAEASSQPPPQEEFTFPNLPSKWGPIACFLVCATAYVVVHYTDELDIWKVAATLQVSAYAVLALKVFAKQSVAGLSAGKLTLDALALSLRMIALSWKGIRLPRDADNDFIKAAELSSFVLAIALLLAALLLFRRTYQSELDTFNAAVPGFACVAAALVLRADVTHAGFLPDAMWTSALYLDAVAMLPQMQLIARNGGVADEATGHHIALMFFSRLLGLLFWWMIKGHWAQGLSYTGWGIMFLYYVQLLLLSNFLCYYLKGVLTRGILTGVPIVCSDN